MIVRFLCSLVMIAAASQAMAQSNPKYTSNDEDRPGFGNGRYEDYGYEDDFGRPPRSEGSTGVIYGQSDSCDMTRVEAIIRPETNCDSLSNAPAWSIKTNGVCQNIPDTTVQSACRAIKYANVQNAIYGQSDSCEGSKIEAVIDDRTRCENLSHSAAWSVKVNGVCQNIPDTTVQAACRAIKYANVRNAIYGQSDSCEGSKIEAVINNRTRCEELSNAAAWSIKVDGVCRNIPDTTVQAACRAIKYEDAPNAIYGQSDSCEGSKIEAVINNRTRCEDLSNSAAWSIKINGQCMNIPDTTVYQACVGMKTANAPDVVYGQSDSCEMTKAISAITTRTRCENLGGTSAWSIKINGRCINIPDTDATRACYAVQVELSGAGN